MSIKEYLSHSVSQLEEKCIDEARLKVELILTKVLECDRIQLYIDHDKPLSRNEKDNLDMLVERLLKHEPIQYILGSAQFYGYEFNVNNKVLIPRPETELLVDYVINDIMDCGLNPVSIFEVGTGSGCISIAIGKVLRAKSIDFEIFSIDKSSEAVTVADSNKQINSLAIPEIRFYNKDVFEINRLTRNYDYIISNPPYVSIEDYDLLMPEVRLYEPKDSLTDSKEGLSFFERLFLIISDSEFKGKLFCEIGFGQRIKLEELLKKYGLSRFEFYKDYSSVERVLKVSK